MSGSAESEIKVACGVIFPQGICSSSKISSDTRMALGVGYALRLEPLEGLSYLFVSILEQIECN